MKTVLKYLYIILLALAMPTAARAFAPDTYAPASALAEGRWVRISVSETGMHLVSNSDLRSWGFTDPSKVRVYGYGGRRIADQFTASTYVDDLPVVQSETTARGIVFYGVATDTRIDVAKTQWHYRAYNPYDTKGYYFLSDREAEPREIPVEGREPQGETLTVFAEGLFHEKDETSPMESGHLLLGEDFRFNPTRQFKFQMPGRVEGTDVWMQCDFYAASSSTTQLSFTANGGEIASGPSDRVRASQEDGDTCRIRKVFRVTGETLNLGITAKGGGSMRMANLDNLAVGYVRALAMPSSGTLAFGLPVGSPELAGATADTRVWDVTSPLAITRMKVTATPRGVAWTNEFYGNRRYVAWNENATFLTPRIADRNVGNQNLHGTANPDMVIVTHPSLKAQAERIAALHAAEPDTLAVQVVTLQEVYNEFSSGTADYNAFRRLMKMYYDRSVADPSLKAPKYLLLMGGVTYDHRGLTAAWRGSGATIVPTWQTDIANNESYSYCSDDPVAFLEDNAGLMTGRDKMNIAVGRVPARSVREAEVFTDRLESYIKSPGQGEWRNRVLLLADDGDSGIHLTQTETVEQSMRGNGSGEDMTYRKVYLDAFALQGGVTVAAREKLHSLLTDGVVWWNYIGHASPTALSGEGVFTIDDVRGLYLRKPAFFYGATCSFVEWDRIEEAGLQKLTLEESGGLIGGIAAVRPVQIARNGPFSATMASELFTRGNDGRMRPVAEVLRLAKNRTLNENNKMRYVMLGDPAMRLAIPGNTVSLDSVNGIKVTPIDDDTADPVVIPAFSRVRFAGSVLDSDGRVTEGFDGYVSLTLYDAEQSFSTVRGDFDNPYVADEQGERLFTGRGTVKGGRWSVEVVLPSEIADNYRPATLSLYARCEADGAEALGVSRDLYVYGITDDGITDNVAPEIEYLYLNHETFRSGDTVNDTPMLLARVSDNTALNMAANGIGHQMSLRIDNTTTLTDISASFTPDADGTPGGVIAYQMPEIKTGAHHAVFKVWDVAGNSATSEFDFFVDPTVAPKIFDVYTDANPATVEANFYISHNRPDAMLDVAVEIYDISGRKVWTSSVKGRADMFSSAPVRWDLTDGSGRRVGRGIYLYRTTVTTDGSQPSTETRRLAVAPM